MTRLEGGPVQAGPSPPAPAPCTQPPDKEEKEAKEAKRPERGYGTGRVSGKPPPHPLHSPGEGPGPRATRAPTAHSPLSPSRAQGTRATWRKPEALTMGAANVH